MARDGRLLALVGLWSFGCGRVALERGPEKVKSGEPATALASFEASGAAQCAAEGPPTMTCCHSLAEKAEGLLAAGDRTGAVTAYERARDRCPKYVAIRSRLFTISHPGATDPATAPEVSLSVSLSAHLSPDLLLTWHAAFLDGELLVSSTRRLASGPHLVEAEFYLRPFGADGPERRVTVSRTLEVPSGPGGGDRLAGNVSLRVKDEGTGAPAARVLAADLELTPLETTAAVRARTASQEAARRAAGAKLQRSRVDAGGLVSTPTRPAGIPPGTAGWTQLRVCVGKQGIVKDVFVLATRTQR